MKIGRVFLALFFLVLIVLIASVARSTDNCDYYIQHPPSEQHPGGWGECAYYPTQQPTTQSTNPPTTEPTQVVEPTVTTVVITEVVQPTQIPTLIEPKPTREVPVSTPQATEPVVVPTVIPPTTAFFNSPAPSFDCGNSLTENFITVWSVIGEGFGWQVRINDVWYDVYACKCSTRLTTPVEYRWKFNETTGQDEYTSFTRLTLTTIMSLNPEDYRVIDMQTGQETGVFFSLNEHY
jgi:hypothetical protein